MSKKITELPAASSVGVTDLIAVVDGTTTTTKATVTQILAGANNLVATVSGSTFTQLSGSLQKTSTGTSFLVAGSGINIASGTASSAGQVVVSSNNIFDNNVAYVVLANTASLPNERALTAGNGIQFTDAGVGAALTVRSSNALAALTASLSYTPTGYGTLSLLHSGTTISTYDSVFRVHDLKGRITTTDSTITNVCSFISGTNGRSYGADAYLMAQHPTTIECARWKLSAHFIRTGGSMTLIAADTPLSSSNVAALSGTLTTSGGNIIVQATGTTTGSFNWGVELRVQELGV